MTRIFRTQGNGATPKKVGADETTALQGGRAKNALLAVANGGTPIRFKAS